jgi:hypothetical protein
LYPAAGGGSNEQAPVMGGDMVKSVVYACLSLHGGVWIYNCRLSGRG